MTKVKSILFSILWVVIMLIFPINSGIIATILELPQVYTFLLQGAFMVVAALIPIGYIKIRKHRYVNYGLRKPEKESAKKVLFYIPIVLIALPFLVVGVNLQSSDYFFSLLFFSLAVAIAEEIYFRGIIYTLIKNAFSSPIAIILLTALIFGIGHGASLIGTGDIIATILQIINAFFFGIVAVEIVIITKSLYPAMLLHFLYNLGNHITTASGITEIVCISVQVAMTIGTALLCGINIKKEYQIQGSHKRANL